MSLTHIEKRHVTRWVLRLRGLTKASPTDDIDATSLEDYAAILGRTLPSEAFTDASLEAALGDRIFFPSVTEIRRDVSAWWSSMQPPRPRIEAPKPSEFLISDEERAAVKAKFAALVGHLKTGSIRTFVAN